MCSLLLFSPFALKKIDTQLTTHTVTFFFNQVGGRRQKVHSLFCFISLLYMDQHCGNQGQVKFMIPG